MVLNLMVFFKRGGVIMRRPLRTFLLFVLHGLRAEQAGMMGTLISKGFNYILARVTGRFISGSIHLDIFLALPRPSSRLGHPVGMH